MNSEEYIKKWLHDELTESELKDFEGTKEFQSLKKLSDRIQGFKAPDFDVEAELTRLKPNLSTEAKIIKMAWLKPLMAVAAVFVIAAASFIVLFYSNPTEVQTLATEKTEIYLPDSSLVLVNAESKLSFEPKKWSDKRQVKLQGEAFFKVAKGAKFDVVTKSGVISVLGTQFNVKMREGYFEVVCFEGLVQVQTKNEQVDLPANYSFRVLNGITNQGIQEEISSAPSWIQFESSFESVPFNFVIAEFEHQFGIKIETENVDKDKIFTGSFTHTDMMIAIEAITQPLNLSYKLAEDSLLILSGSRE